MLSIVQRWIPINVLHHSYKTKPVAKCVWLPKVEHTSDVHFPVNGTRYMVSDYTTFADNFSDEKPH